MGSHLLERRKQDTIYQVQTNNVLYLLEISYAPTVVGWVSGLGWLILR